RSIKCLGAVVVATIMAGCSQTTAVQKTGSAIERQDTIVRLVETVRKDPSKKADLERALMSGPVLVIPDPKATPLALLFFDQPERAFIPVFSSREIFDQEAYGTGFEGKAISIDADRFASLLKGNEVVILNPGHRPAIEFRASDLKALAR